MPTLFLPDSIRRQAESIVKSMKPHFKGDVDAWIGLNDDWDLNILWDADGLSATVYPVVDGNTITTGQYFDIETDGG